jgi:soluble lytic murein transglycosylase
MMEAFLFCIALYASNFPTGEAACEHAETLIKYSKEYEVDREVLTSLIYFESGWRPNRVSKSKACGLTQVIPRWTKPFIGKRYNCRQLKDPETSIKVGAHFLSKHLESSEGNYNQALCFYNRGPRGCHRTKIIKKRGTSYSRKILKLTNKIKRKLEPELNEK